VAGRKILIDVTKAGRLGGLARAENLTETELSEGGRKAVQARWDAYYKAHPEKLKAKKDREKRSTERAITKARSGKKHDDTKS
jgi:hypothetical protein